MPTPIVGSRSPPGKSATFNRIVAGLISLSARQVYAGAGWMASVAKWAIGFAGGTQADAKAVFAVLIIPSLMMTLDAGYLHDHVVKLGLFGLKQPEPPPPPERLRDW